MKPYQDKEQLTELLKEHHSYKAVVKVLGIKSRTAVLSLGKILCTDATVFYKRKYARFQVLKRYMSRQSEMTGQ